MYSMIYQSIVLHSMINLLWCTIFFITHYNLYLINLLCCTNCLIAHYNLCLIDLLFCTDYRVQNKCNLWLINLLCFTNCLITRSKIRKLEFQDNFGITSGSLFYPSILLLFSFLDSHLVYPPPWYYILLSLFLQYFVLSSYTIIMYCYKKYQINKKLCRVS